VSAGQSRLGAERRSPTLRTRRPSRWSDGSLDAATLEQGQGGWDADEEAEVREEREARHRRQPHVRN
jgi:hypothetical protein